MTGHIIICGWGRVGTASAQYLTSLGREIVVIDREPDRLRDIEHPTVIGDVTDDRTLEAAGIAHAHALISASTPTPTTCTSRCRAGHCARISSSSPAPGTRGRCPNWYAPAPTGL